MLLLYLYFLTEQVKQIAKDQTKPLELKERDLKEISAKIEQETQKKIDLLNEKVEKQNEENTKVAKILQEAQKKGDAAQVAKMATLLKEGKEEVAKINNEKKGLENYAENTVKKLLEVYSKPWYRKINYKNPWIYGSVIGIILILVLIWYLIKKAISWFSPRN